MEYDVYYTDGYVIHYGVRGMKWGRRKAPETTTRTPRSSTNQNESQSFLSRHKKAIAIGGALGVAGAAAGAYAYGRKAGYIEKGELGYRANLLTKSGRGTTIRKGSTVTRANKGAMNLNDSRTYFTNKLSDHKKYLTNATGTNVSSAGDMRSVTLKAKQAIKAPSERAQTKAFMKFLNADPDSVAKSLAESYVGAKGDPEEKVKAAAKYKEQFRLMSKSQKSTKLYQQFMDSLVEGNIGADNAAARDKFWGQLEKAGYNAVTDQVDKRSGFTKNPLIAFKGNAVFDKVSEMPWEEAIKKYKIK